MFVANGDDGNEPETSIFTSMSSNVEWSQPCRPFEFNDLLSATENFKESLVIGRGGFGKVYKAKIVIGSSPVLVAIKRLEPDSNQGEPEFWVEVLTMAKLRHNNLVSLIGYCNLENEKLLIYEYIPNETLHEHRYSVRSNLSWIQRLKICIDVARGLDYLHTGTSSSIIHRDVKTGNILLSQCWTAKIADFGLSKSIPRDQQDVDTSVRGTFGYLDPEYFYTGKLTSKSDVYAFGVVLLEVLCRRKALYTLAEEKLESLVKWGLLSIKEGRLKHIIDPDIKYEISPKCLSGFVQIAERCLDNVHDIVLRWLRFFSLLSLEFRFRIPKKQKLLILREEILQKIGTFSLKDKSKRNCFGSIKMFRAKELEKATENYAQDRILGRGAHGIVYKGILQDKSEVAVKKHRILSQSRLEQLITEIVILEHAHHKNVVSLLGCCFDTEATLLVYEFVSSGTLHHAIQHGTSGMGILSWENRLMIARESPEALAYLHKHARVSIVHRDVKSTNILLDENYNPRIIDFGSSVLIPLDCDPVRADIQGTLGYLDPEYVGSGQLSYKTDVYSFGVVLSELLTGKKAFDRRRDDEDVNLSRYFVRETDGNRLHLILDPIVLEQASDEQLSRARDLVRRCLEQSAHSRPTMKEVAMELETLMIA